MSPTLHSGASQIAWTVEKRTASAWLFLSTRRLTIETPTRLASSVSGMPRSASTVSR